jgi:hypothetical protein
MNLREPLRHVRAGFASVSSSVSPLELAALVDASVDLARVIRVASRQGVQGTAVSLALQGMARRT